MEINLISENSRVTHKGIKPLCTLNVGLRRVESKIPFIIGQRSVLNFRRNDLPFKLLPQRRLTYHCIHITHEALNLLERGFVEKLLVCEAEKVNNFN